jgi:hypothetical protein
LDAPAAGFKAILAQKSVLAERFDSVGVVDGVSAVGQLLDNCG